MQTLEQAPVGTIERSFERRDALVGRLFEATLGTFDVFTVYIGDRLGLYRGLADLGSATSGELAAATDTDERYVREWLEQQAATGILEAFADADPAVRRYRLPTDYEEVLLDRDSLNGLSGLLRLVVGVTRPLSTLLDAFRTGRGIPYPVYGADTRVGIAEMNRPLFLNLLATEWLPRVSDVHARLQADPPAQVADMGCGTGWSSIAIARAYPRAQVHGFDLDEASIAQARANAAVERLGKRLTF
jgi:hypothetical protein